MNKKTKFKNASLKIGDHLEELLEDIDGLRVKRINFPSRRFQAPNRKINEWGTGTLIQNIFSIMDRRVFDEVLQMSKGRRLGTKKVDFFSREDSFWDLLE